MGQPSLPNRSSASGRFPEPTTPVGSAQPCALTRMSNPDSPASRRMLVRQHGQAPFVDVSLGPGKRSDQVCAVVPPLGVAAPPASARQGTVELPRCGAVPSAGQRLSLTSGSVSYTHLTLPTK